jgi:hypothetical protein
LLGLTRFAHRVPAVVPVFVFLAVAWADFGAGLNIPALFWHEPFDEYGHGQWGFGLMNGLSVTLLFAYLWSVTFVLDATFNPDALAGREKSWLTRCASRLYPTATDAPLEAEQFRAYMAVTFLPCVLALALATVIEANGKAPFVHFATTDKFAERQEPLLAQRWPILAGVALGLVALRALQFASRRLARDTSWLVALGRRVRRVFVTRTETKWLQGLMEAVFGAQALLFAALALATLCDWYAPPVVAVCVLFGLLAGVLSWVWYQWHRWALPVFAGIAVLLALANLPDHKVRFPDLDYANPVSLRDREHPKDKWETGDDWARTVNNIEARLARFASDKVPDLRARFGALPNGAGAYALLLKLAEGAPELAPLAQCLEHAAQPVLLNLYDDVSAAQIAEELSLLGAWAAGAPKGPSARPKLVIVTVTGGANRSALWTTTVLDNLHRDPGLPGFASTCASSPARPAVWSARRTTSARSKRAVPFRPTTTRTTWRSTTSFRSPAASC